MEDYDIIVAGAGMAGLTSAITAAKNGAKVLLLDRNKEEEPGKKTNWGWICGDAVAKVHLERLMKATGISLDYPELNNKINAVVAYSPDMEKSFAFEGEGYALNRPLFERKLRDYAIKLGVEYIPEFEVEGPIIENNYVVGVFGKDKNKEHKTFRAKIVIDALGIATTLRRRLPDNEFVSNKHVDVDDLESTGRFLFKAKIKYNDERYYSKDKAIIHLNQLIAPGGYGWVFPKSNNVVNIGIGVQKKSLEIYNTKLNKKETLHSLMSKYAKELPVFEALEPYDEEFNNKGVGYWSVSVKRQFESLVFNGYMCVGDSATMPNPLSAGGIGPAITGGVICGADAAEAIKNNDFSVKGLWKYNLDFNEAYGNKTAGLEAFRIYLQSLNNDLLNYGMKVFVDAAGAEALAYGNIDDEGDSAIKTVVKAVISGSSNLRAFKNLIYTVRKMRKLNGLYNRYPKDYKRFGIWKAKVEYEIEEVKERFKPNPV
ncbi:MAG: geranylgeranyl hydrogenase [Candidatus Micrarchaeota archaeon]|nr:MAG: geranylgeranyl hydrogenase [Candidatus Micrarchaeota archaeon]